MNYSLDNGLNKFRSKRVFNRPVAIGTLVVAGAALMASALSAPAHAQTGSNLGAAAAQQGGQQTGRTDSGLPLPRFVSLKSDRVNIRGGPGLDHRILWVFRRAGLPVEVLKEYQGWRQIRDAEGGTGWVLGALLSGRRTALVLPWESAKKAKAQTQLHESGDNASRTVAFIQPGVLASISKCSGTWCEVSIGQVTGFIEQNKLWGIYANERLK